MCVSVCVTVSVCVVAVVLDFVLIFFPLLARTVPVKCLWYASKFVWISLWVTVFLSFAWFFLTVRTTVLSYKVCLEFILFYFYFFVRHHHRCPPTIRPFDGLLCRRTNPLTPQCCHRWVRATIMTTVMVVLCGTTNGHRNSGDHHKGRVKSHCSSAYTKSIKFLYRKRIC